MAHKALLRALAVFVLVLNFLPIAAFAQEVNEDLVGVYVSETIEDQDSGDTLDITLTLFDDGTLEAVSITTSADESKTDLETGTWEDNGDDTITIFIVDYNGEAYDEPIEITFDVADGVLQAADLTDFGEDGLVLELTDDEPVSVAEELLGEMEATGEDDAEIVAVELPGLWLATEIDADGVPAGVMLYLNEDGTAQSTAMVFGEEPLVNTRTGEWEDDGEGTVTVTMTSEVDAEGEIVELDEEEAVEFAFDGAALVNELFTLYPDDNLADADDDSGDDTADDTATGDDLGDSITYLSPMDQMMDGTIIALMLLEDGIASISTQLGADADQIVETGFWEESAENEVTVTFTADADGNEYDEPIVIVFEVDPDTGSLTGVDYDPELYGEELMLEATVQE